MDAHQTRVPLKIQEYTSKETSNIPLPVVHASGGGGTLAISGFPADSADGQTIVVTIDGDGDGTEGSSTFAWSFGGTVQNSGVTTSSASVLSNTGITLDFPDAGNDSTHSWYFTCQKLDLVAASPSNVDGSHYAARLIKCQSGSGQIRVDMPGANDATITLSHGEEVRGEFLRLTSTSNTIDNLRVSW